MSLADASPSRVSTFQRSTVSLAGGMGWPGTGTAQLQEGSPLARDQ